MQPFFDAPGSTENAKEHGKSSTSSTRSFPAGPWGLGLSASPTGMASSSARSGERRLSCLSTEYDSSPAAHGGLKHSSRRGDLSAFFFNRKNIK